MDREYLKSILHYDPETGIFTWITDTRRGVRKGVIAGYGSSRITIQIDGLNYLAHRLAWFYMTGVWPTEFIDHIDNNSLNNKWNNLREATNRQNQYNVTKRKPNATGVKGVYKARNRFRAMLQTPDGIKHLGIFDTVEEAAKVYDDAAIELQGEYFARLDP